MACFIKAMLNCYAPPLIRLLQKAGSGIKNIPRVILNPFLLCIICSGFIGCRLHKSSHATHEDSNAIINPGKISIVEKLKENAQLPIVQRVALYKKLKRESPKVYNFEDEDQLTLYGYSLLWNNKMPDAIEIFKLIVEEFPNSSNAYDSLGEAFLKSGDKIASLANYTASLKLNPENFNAEDQIELIMHPEKVNEKPTDQFAKIFTKVQYQQDLDQMGKTLLKVHPNALKFISKEAFWKTIEEKKAMITDSTSYGEFVWHCSEIIANIHCSHTSLDHFAQESGMLPLSLRFPLQTRWINNQLFVIDPLNNEKKVKVKDEIVSINGIVVANLLKEIYRHISTQGFIETTKKHFFNTWATGMIPFALRFPKSYTIMVKGSLTPMVLNKAESFKNLFWDPSIKYCGNDLCLEISDSIKTAVLTISSFNYYRWNNYDVFKRFIDSSFMEMNTKGIRNLIIDVRFNGGGSQSASIHLLRYLVDKPFTYYSTAQFEGKKEKIEGEEAVDPYPTRFKRKLYFIMDGIGNSTTGHFMSIVKYLNLGTIVGEELGSNQFCSAGQQICRLSHTKLVYYVANNTHESLATSFPDETGILPDYYVTQSIDEYLNKIDAVKLFTIKLINKQH